MTAVIGRVHPIWSTIQIRIFEKPFGCLAKGHAPGEMYWNLFIYSGNMNLSCSISPERTRDSLSCKCTLFILWVSNRPCATARASARHAISAASPFERQTDGMRCYGIYNHRAHQLLLCDKCASCVVHPLCDARALLCMTTHYMQQNVTNWAIHIIIPGFWIHLSECGADVRCNWGNLDSYRAQLHI